MGKDKVHGEYTEWIHDIANKATITGVCMESLRQHYVAMAS